ncbi:hypothetical protein ACHAQJ_000312 [Trichoderma viride]
MVSHRAHTGQDISNGDYGENGIRNQYSQESTPATDAVITIHQRIIHDLANDESFVDNFLDTLSCDEGQEYAMSTGDRIFASDVFEIASDGSNIIHSLIEAVLQPHSVADATKFTVEATRLTAGLVQFRNELIINKAKIAEQNDISTPKCGRNPLEFASMYEECIDLVKAMCEYGIVATLTKKERDAGAKRLQDQGRDPSIYFVETEDGNYICRYIAWNTLIKHNHDSCLHMAIRGKNNLCAEYLIDRIRLTKETDVLGCCDHTGLTLLHLAVDFEKCTEEQVKFVEFLVKRYPKALKMKSGEMSYNDNVDRPGPEKGYRNAGRAVVKSNAAPYKYFLESKEQTENSNISLEKDINMSRSVRLQYGGLSTTGSGGLMQATTRARTSANVSKSNAAEKMADLLKLSCMRQFGRDRSTLRELLDTQNQIHLDLNQRTQVTARFLNHIAKMKLEQYLQYVAIPNLQVVEVQNKDLEKKAWWESPGRKDYAYIFHWLRHSAGVTKIIRIVVEDDPKDPHSDEVIEHSLKDFDVEEWKWFKWDLCIDTIFVAAPNVREVTLYWSGNKAILKGWAAFDGLASLRQASHVLFPKYIDNKMTP